jgi:hypothetical protein
MNPVLVLAKKGYVPPTGFDGHKWQAPLSDFKRFGPEPLSVQVAYAKARTKTDFTCVPSTRSETGVATSGCDFNATMATLTQRQEGDLYHAVAQYNIEDQAFRFESSGVLLYPVIYQFCTRWHGDGAKPPADFNQQLKFCGMRMIFKSETEQELQDKGPDYVSQSQRVLKTLIKMYGTPEKYSLRGLVSVGDPNDAKAGEHAKLHAENWRWCPAVDTDIAPSTCEASVVYSFDPVTAKGLILYVTKPIWEFADARETGGFAGEPLYKTLHNLK